MLVPDRSRDHDRQRRQDIQEQFLSSLAIFGGPKTIQGEFPPYPSIGDAERRAVLEVITGGSLSGFYGSYGEQFLGGTWVRRLEKEWLARFGCAHAITMNSATSCLSAAMGAIGISPGDEVILAPTTMSATAMAPLSYGGIPVFVDIDPSTFCMSVDAAAAALTSQTRAILVTNLFGQPAELAKLRALADSHGIFLIEDNAQGPLAAENGRYAGTIGHIGVFSLNYHKHIHCGEGGVCATDDPTLALRLQAIRNHAENIVDPAGIADLTNMVGANYRLSELSAAVAIAQLADADGHVERRERIARRLSEGLKDLDGVTIPLQRSQCRHVFYVWAAKLDAVELGVDRGRFSRALAAEGFPHFTGYVAPLYWLPIFQRRKAIGRDGFPFNLAPHVSYERGLCPVAERMHVTELMGFEPCIHNLSDHDIDQLIAAFRKVHANRAELRRLN